MIIMNELLKRNFIDYSAFAKIIVTAIFAHFPAGVVLTKHEIIRSYNTASFSR